MTASDIELETVAVILRFRSEAQPCNVCGKQPLHTYEPGCRIVGCESEKCPRIVDDCSLTKAFKKWNTARLHEKQLGKVAKR